MMVDDQAKVNPHSGSVFKALFHDAGVHRYFAVACLVWFFLCPLLSFTVGRAGFNPRVSVAASQISLFIGFALILPACGFCTLFLYSAKMARQNDRNVLVFTGYCGFLFAAGLLLFGGWLYVGVLMNGIVLI
ncbi:hypothetical protein HZU75_02265 [Chitinibacter fontanus]|uniref:Uncharacterized protein n=1 Tax=Chitinibacter fontanus TaxID=1737446 RepID=A0A7D5V845_9NEIS|nr:hypothetical protein [Chitinibacter fontanus]QLI80455.1 hypothetical protein HZU75_02265 [Chitinibacter fontanus]